MSVLHCYPRVFTIQSSESGAKRSSDTYHDPAARSDKRDRVHEMPTTRPRPRAHDLGVPFDGTPGPFDAITDVAGVEVGHRTLVSGEGELKVGVGPVRTGVT